MRKTTKFLLIFEFIFFISFVNVALLSKPVSVEARTPVAGDAVLLSGDVIKNFRFTKLITGAGETLTEEPIVRNGAFYDTGVRKNAKLKFDSEPVFTVYPDEVELIQAYTIDEENRTYFYYKVPMYMKINIYTNVFMDQASTAFSKTTFDFNAWKAGTTQLGCEGSPMGFNSYWSEFRWRWGGVDWASPDPWGVWEWKAANYLAGASCVGCTGCSPPLTSAQCYAMTFHTDPSGNGMIESNMIITHHNFGEVYNHNLANNDFGGTLIMDFDIAPNILPNSITDEFGEPLFKDFDYVAVSSAKVVDSDYGDRATLSSTVQVAGLMEDQEKEVDPTLASNQAEDYSAIRTKASENSIAKSIAMEWEPTITTVGGEVESDFYVSFNSPHTKGASLNPTQIDGSAIWDPKEQQQSMSNCRLYYDLESISPTVRVYSNNFRATTTKLHLQDCQDWLVFNPRIGRSYEEDDVFSLQSKMEVFNKYIQSQIKVVMTVFTSYTFIPKMGPDGSGEDGLGTPDQYIDNITWLLNLLGFGGGTLTTVTPKTPFEMFFDDLFAFLSSPGGLLVMIVILVVVIGVIYVVMKVMGGGAGSIARGAKRGKTPPRSTPYYGYGYETQEPVLTAKEKIKYEKWKAKQEKKKKKEKSIFETF